MKSTYATDYKTGNRVKYEFGNETGYGTVEKEGTRFVGVRTTNQFTFERPRLFIPSHGQLEKI